MNVCYTNSAEETAAWAARLGATLQAGCFIAIDGELGAGKTVLAQGVARGLGVAGPVVSPTFTLLRAYDSGRLPFYHFDVYRIGGADELDDIGFFEYAAGDGVCVCEWASLIAAELPPDRIDVSIERTGESARKITWGAAGHPPRMAGD
jgi:tRNA threonylcarbamoyladenosine biosynthesis protein TsaE